MKQRLHRKPVEWDFQQLQEFSLEGCQLRHKVPGGSVRQGDRPDGQILKFLKNDLGGRVSDILSIGKQLLESPVSSDNIFFDRALHQHQQLEHNFEEEEKGLNSRWRLEANRFQGIVTFGASVRVFGFVLRFLLPHCVIQIEVRLGDIGHQGIIAAAVSSRCNRLVIPRDRQVKVIGEHRQALIAGGRTSGFRIFIARLGLISNIDRDILGGVICVKNLGAGLLNRVMGFELIAVQLAPQSL